MSTVSATLDLKGDRTMCFSDPAKVMSIAGSTARVMTSDGLHDVSLRLMEAADESAPDTDPEKEFEALHG